MTRLPLALLLLLAAAPAALAQDATPEPTPSPTPADGSVRVAANPAPRVTPAPAIDVVIVDSRLDPSRVAGSAHRVSEEALERHEYDDPHRVLYGVPGVYLRGEDGWGLRPNIGIRGASADRSAKVTLMEDGILLAPAPYSAPAAYYFPLMTRMSAVEVYKGPGAIQFGPNTVGGAINLVTRPATSDATSVDLSAGQYRSGKVHARWGSLRSWGGALVEAVHLQSDGFKRLDGGGETGFDKNELMLKLHGDVLPRHRVELKLGFSDERSDETYLGLTDADFRDDPWRRYAASALDRMEWTRTQVAASHHVDADWIDVRTTAYRHDFSRAWRKLNRFAGGPSLADVLANPDGGQEGVYAAILRGEEDSTTPDQTLMIGTNDRRFVSQGVQSIAGARFTTGQAFHSLQLGARLHYDHIDRTHTEDAFQMRSGDLVADATPTATAADNLAQATALALHALDEISIGDVLLTPGARFERIETRFRDALAGTSSAAVDYVALPGLGAVWRVRDGLSVLAGVHQGFSPVAPGQPDAVQPEKSWSFEAGARHSGPRTQLEAVAFLNEYFNLTTQCTQSGGCDESNLNRQFNAGAARVFGLEATAGGERDIAFDAIGRVGLSYTFTRTELLTTFESEDPQLGSVEAGDELPYVPEHQISLSAGIDRGPFSLTASAVHVTRMREEAGQGAIPRGKATDPFTIVDLSARWSATPRNELYLNVENLLGEEYIASRRPFGARPGKPLQVLVGFRHRFGG